MTETEQLVQLIERSDMFRDAYTALLDAGEQGGDPEFHRDLLARLEAEGDAADEEAARYRQTPLA
jgi:hypothetical protein